MDLDSYIAQQHELADDRERLTRLVGERPEDHMIGFLMVAPGATDEANMKAAAERGASPRGWLDPSKLQPGIPTPAEEALAEPSMIADLSGKIHEKVIKPVGAAAAKGLMSAPGVVKPAGMTEESIGQAGASAASEFAQWVPGLPTSDWDPTLATVAAIPLVGQIGRAGKAANKLIRPRFNVEAALQKTLTSEPPSELAKRVTEAVNKQTAVLPDAVLRQKADALVQSGGVSVETVRATIPGTAHERPEKALAAAEVMTREHEKFLALAQHAKDSRDPVAASAAWEQLNANIDPIAGFEGLRTATAQAQRSAQLAMPEIDAMRRTVERVATLSEDMTDLEKIDAILADPAVDPVRQGKAVSPAYKQLHQRLQTVAATADETVAKSALQEITTAIEHGVNGEPVVIEPISSVEVAEAQTAQLSLFPEGKPKPGAIPQNVGATYPAPGKEEGFKLTPENARAPLPKQADFLASEEAAKAATLKEHQAQAHRAATGQSVFSPKREPFKLTPPPGGATTRQTFRAPGVLRTQLDLLFTIVKDPAPEQLALEMAAAIDHPEISREFLSMIRKIDDAVHSGNTAKVQETMAALHKRLFPKEYVKHALPPRQMTAFEKGRLKEKLLGAKAKGLNDIDALQALMGDLELTPGAIATALANADVPGWRDLINFHVINGLLSLTSDAVNLGATALWLGYQVPARTVAARVGQVIQKFGGAPGVPIGSDDAMIHGLVSSVWDAIKVGATVFKTQRPVIGTSFRHEQRFANPMTAETLFRLSPTVARAWGGGVIGGLSGGVVSDDPATIAGFAAAGALGAASVKALNNAGPISRAIDFYGTATGLTGRLMVTGDQMLAYMGMQAEGHSLVYEDVMRKAYEAGADMTKARKDYGPLMRSLRAALPPEIRAKGEQFSLEATLNAKLGPLGNWGMRGREILNDFTGVGGTVYAPFFRTLANGAKASWSISPGAIATNAIGVKLEALQHDMFGLDPRKRDIALGKWALGSTIMSSIMWATINGRFIGSGPSDKELRLQRREAQGLPDSFIYNTDTGESVQFSRLGTLGNLVQMGVNFGEIWLQMDALTRQDAAALMATTAVQALHYDFLKGDLVLLEALLRGFKDKTVLDAAIEQSTLLIPWRSHLQFYDEMTRTEPAYLKDARTLMEHMQARHPGYDYLAKKFGMEPVPPLRNQFGQAVEVPPAAFGSRAYNPIWVSTPHTDEPLRKLLQWEYDHGMSVSQPEDEIGPGKVLLNNKQREQLQIITGNLWAIEVKELLEQRGVDGQDFLDTKRVADVDKIATLQRQLTEVREAGRQIVLGGSTQLLSETSEAVRQKHLPPNRQLTIE